MDSTIELVSMIASLIMMGIILLSEYGFRRVRGVGYLIGLTVCRFIYSGAIIMEQSRSLLMEKLIFRNVQHTMLNLMVPFLVLFVYYLIGSDKVIKLRWKVLLFTVFVLWSLLVWFDPELHLIFRTIEFYNGQLITTRTIYSIIFTLVCYSIVSVCIYFLVHYVRSIRDEFRKPGMWVLFLGSFPFVLEIVKFLNPEMSSWLLRLSVYCGFTGIIMLVIAMRYKFFSIVPYARDAVLDTLQEGILIANASGKIIDSNKQAVQWLSELGHAEIYNRDMAELLAPWPQWQKLCKSMQQGSVEIDTWLYGERKIYSVNVYPLQKRSKQTQGSISLIFDITEKQRHLEQIAQLNQLKDQLFTIVSHDIRSPLALQFQLVELLEEDRGRMESDHREIVEALGGQIRNTLGMANNLLEWFRSQREDIVLRPQRLELSEVVEECIHLLHITSEAKQINMHHTIAAETYVYADQQVLGLVIRNLLSNAIKFSGQGGSVHIEAQLSEDMVVVSIRDDGVGMDEEQVHRLLSEQQLNSLTGTLGEKGAGLGLLVSRQFIKLSGGDLWVESKLGQGSLFQFSVRGGTER
ncbi:Signal transduction histidine kinase [Paenibacillus algorifonticola]|uniref:histidine kinase n=1 Tax=Paenibacillus algorifonticola TaxID=684063 RepID=A0A1I2DNY8_9BACL|nr:ATP-binding protein [Paenibacillus algorifonticola]SFE81650.1 Signal transduction histidine kinase [Paenibacillus algorifonticola]